MIMREEVARARKLSNDALLARLASILGSSRRLTGLLIAHLAEVEVRRLHLLAGYASMFEYCTARLGMSEDEACRRIEVARLARLFPLLYDRLASGSLSLSVAALLKHHLTEANHAGLLDAMSGKTVARAREVLAEWFPQPDVPPSIRKLPERRAERGATEHPSAELSRPRFDSMHPGNMRPGNAAPGNIRPDVEIAGAPTPSLNQRQTPTARTDASAVAEQSAPDTPWLSTQLSPPPRSPRSLSNIAPLSPGRFKVSFTADADLKQKLDLARDLLRHAVPSGDLATIVTRALDLLIERTEKRRFAKTSRPKTKGTSTQVAQHADANGTPAAPAPVGMRGTRNDSSAGLGGCAVADPAPLVTEPEKSLPQEVPLPPTPRVPPPSRYLAAAVRRAVHERDGTRCTWQAPDGTRCNSRAWLEHDHIIPRGQGGTNDPANIHPYCRAHNRLAAEQAYGQATITRIITRRRAPRDSADSTYARHPPP